MRPTTQPGQPRPTGALQSVAPSTPTTDVQRNAADAASTAQMAAQFHTPMMVGNMRLSAGSTTTMTLSTTASTTTTTTTSTATATTAALAGRTNSSQGVPEGVGDPALNPTNSSSGAVSSGAQATATQAVPDWVRNLAEGSLPRGDECFRERYGNHVSLLDNDGATATGFTSDPNKCDPGLRLSAEILAAFMEIRNEVVADLLVANAALKTAEEHLLTEQNRLATAQEGALQPGSADFFELQQNVDTASASCEAAQTACDKLKKNLDDAQNNLQIKHDEAAIQVAPREPDPAMAQEQALHEIWRRHLQSYGPEGQTLEPFAKPAVYGLSFVWSMVANALAQSQDLHISRLVAPLLPSLHIDDVKAAEHERDLLCSILIGLVLAHILVKSGWLG